MSKYLIERLSILIAATFCCLSASAADNAKKLDVARLFQSPGLNGPAPRAVRISPDSSRVTFIRGSDQDQFQLDLWEYSIKDDALRILVDSRSLSDGPEQLSEEEIGRRERQRLAGLKGIVDYHFSPDGQRLLFPLSGDLYVYSLADGGLQRITDTDSGETDPKFSSTGRYISFIRDQNLVIVELENGSERQLTNDGGGEIKNGMAEFIAQEEMDRDTGYWWSPDDSAIAFARVDESPVQITERFEVYAEEFKVFSQRYPATGTPNVEIRIGVIQLPSGETTWMDIGDNADIYVARVSWFPDGSHIALQRLSRDQQTLDLLKIDAQDGSSRVLITEQSKTWINLYDDLSFLDKSPRFIWASERSGFKHFYLYSNDGELLQALTAGDWEVTGNRASRALLHIDEDNELVYFMATKESPLERHVYRTSFSNQSKDAPTRLSLREGMHKATFAESGEFYVDHFSGLDTPPQISVHTPDGKRIAYVEQNKLDASHPYYPYLRNKPVIEFGTLKAADNQTLYYRLIKPADFDETRQYPVVVYVYGGPHGQLINKGWTSGGLTEVLANAGFLVFTLDNRGTSFRGVKFDEPIFRQMGEVEVEDQMVGVKYLHSLPYVAGDKIGIYGWSYGGYMTLMSVFKQPDAFAAAIAGAPVTDWALYDTHYTERYLGTPKHNPEGYAASSVFPYAGNLKSPLLIMHGMADDNVLFTNSTKLFKELQSSQRDFDIMTYPGSKHGLLRHPDTGPHALNMILRYFNDHLKE